MSLGKYGPQNRVTKAPEQSLYMCGSACGTQTESLVVVDPAPISTTVLTAAQVAGGVIYTPSSVTGAIAYTFPTATLVQTYLSGQGAIPIVGSTFHFHMVNGGTTSGVITMTAGSGNTLHTSPATPNTFGINTNYNVVGVFTAVGVSPAVTYYW